MDYNTHLNAAGRFLTGLESGNIPVADCYSLAVEIDPLMLFYGIKYLREKYPSDHPDHQGVASRLLEFSTTYNDMVKKMKEGEEDPLREWFEESHSVREFFGDPDKMLTVILDKIES